MRKSYLLAVGLLLWTAHAAHADAIYQVAVNTSSIAGTAGSLDFQFSAGSGETQAASARILNFAGGTLGSASRVGEVTGGPLPSAVTIGNGVQSNSGLNDFFETFTYGSSLTFTLNLSGPAVTAPNGMSTGGSEFFFLMFSDANGVNPVLTTDPNGVAATVTVNPNGSTSTAAVSRAVSFVPEPGSVALVGSALALLIGMQKRRLFNRVG